jgi:hypothetical protein
LEGFSKKTEGDTKELAMSEKIKTWIGSIRTVAVYYNCTFDEVLKWEFDRFLVYYNYIIDELNEQNRLLRQTIKNNKYGH